MCMGDLGGGSILFHYGRYLAFFLSSIKLYVVHLCKFVLVLVDYGESAGLPHR